VTSGRKCFLNRAASLSTACHRSSIWLTGLEAENLAREVAAHQKAISSPGMSASRNEKKACLALEIADLQNACDLPGQSVPLLGGTGPPCRPESARQRSRAARKCSETAYREVLNASES
jgi:hypothetical protein